MIKAPAQAAWHPDRGIDCQMSAEDEFRVLADRIEAAGWSGDEAAAALVGLAKNHVRMREEAMLDAMRIRSAVEAVGY